MKTDHKLMLTVVKKRKGVYEIGGVIFNAESEKDAIRKYTRGVKNETKHNNKL